MTDKTKGVLSYIFGWLGGLIFLLMKDSSQTVKLHAAQSIVASVAYFAITLIYSFLPITIPFFTTAIWGLYIVIIILGIVKACKETEPEIPVIGNIAKSIFGKVING